MLIQQLRNQVILRRWRGAYTHRGERSVLEGDGARRNQRRRLGGRRRRPQLAYKTGVPSRSGFPPLPVPPYTGAFTPLTSPRQFPSLYKSRSCSVSQWLHLRLSHTYPLDQPFQRPKANPLVLPLLTSFVTEVLVRTAVPKDLE